VQMPTSELILQANVSMTANKITVALVTPSSDFVLPPARPPLDVVVGQLPAGAYQVEVTRRFDGSAQTFSLGTTSFSVGQQAPSDPPFNRTDLWWNPNESGWGMNIVQHPSGTIFATWYTYDADQTPAWYVVPSGEWLDNPNGRPNQYVGPIYRTSGPPVADNFDPSRVTRTLVGEAQFTFEGWDSVRAKLTVDGNTVTKDLQRQGF
jgi:hypothetical protein